ncbi:MAG: XRE family transcriptional regulator [Fusobacteriaceae bacterium]
MNFAENLIKIMDGPPKIKGLEFSKKTGISPSMISDIRKGRRVPSWEKLNIIVKVLDISQKEKNRLIELWKREQDSNYESDKQDNSVETVEEKEVLKLYVLGKASAGRGYINFDNKDEAYNFIPSEGLKYKDCFVVRVIGDSMEPEILEDSDLIIDPNRNGIDENINKVVVANVNGEVFVKVLRKINNKIFLESINKKYADIEIDAEDEINLIGKAVEVRYKKILK